LKAGTTGKRALKKSLFNAQGQGGGAPGKVNEAAWAAFKEKLVCCQEQHFTLRDIKHLFEAHKPGIHYSDSYWPKLLREKLGLYYYKPQPRDYRQAENAEEILLERFKACVDALKVMGKDPYKMAIGFADEAAVQLHQNNARFWCAHPHLVRKVNTSQQTVKVFGFQALEGKSLLEPMQECKGENFKPLLRKIRAANADKAGVILFWDNARAHKQVERYAWELGIYVVALPAYSPNLNPIERLWKSCKRWVNEQGLIKGAEELLHYFEQAFQLLKVQGSFTESWREKTQEIICWNSIISCQSD
jgi:transposase